MQHVSSFRSRYIGDRAFFKMVFAIALPIIVQNTVSNFVNLLDNIMVGAIGTESMSGVSIANQILMIYYAGIFGCNAGAGIFAAQFAGAQDHAGVRHTFRFKLYGAAIICTLALIVYLSFGRTFIGLYLTEDASGDAAKTLEYGWQYLKIICLSLIPAAITQVYASTLCETGETAMPMKATVAEVFTNAALNYILIFGKFGFPAMGVVGAAVATLASRFVGLAILLIYTHTHSQKHPFIQGAYASFAIPRKLTMDIIKKGMLLLVNEELWALGMTILMQQYSMRGLMVVAATNICGTVSNMFAMFYHSMGNSVAILAGQALGANDINKAKDIVRKMLVFSVALCIVVGLALGACSPLLPKLYNTGEDVRHLAMCFIIITAVMMPVNGIVNCAYFTLRCGGKTLITFIFDCLFLWSMQVPMAWCLVNLTDLPIVWVYSLCQIADVIKALFGLILVKKGVWINNIIGTAPAEQ